MTTGDGKAPRPLTTRSFKRALSELATRDPVIQSVLDELGPPPMWVREPGFGTLIHVILEQQVSLASARAAFERLRAAVSELTPAGFLGLDDQALRDIGFSRQKTRYCRTLASSILDGSFDLDGLAAMSDEDASRELLRLPGIGQWTSDIYLLMALRRPDVWPSGDLAIAAAVQPLLGLRERPTPDELDRIADVWRPWRAVSARVMWHSYLEE
jgi:DNA-3-methyladenine glycosylase II